jgi:cation:H+ antiporter
MMFLASLALLLGCIFTAKQAMEFEGETNDYYRLSIIGVIVLLVIFITFFIENFISMKNEQVHVEPDPHSIGLQEEDDIVPTKENSTKADWVKNIILFIIGALGIVIGANLLVEYGTDIAVSLHVPQRIISVIAIAIGTSLPELVTTITALKKKVGALSVGNILGANIIDLTLILPICSFISMGKGTGALAVSVSSVQIDMLVCLIASAIAVFPTIITKKFQRWQGIVMLAGYIAYVLFTVLA